MAAKSEVGEKCKFNVESKYERVRGKLEKYNPRGNKPRKKPARPRFFLVDDNYAKKETRI